MASNFYIRYPASGSSNANLSVGPTGSTAPASATEVGFIDNSTGNLVPFSGPSATAGPNVTVTSSTLPTGGATAANQVTQEATLTAIQANQTNGTQHTIVDSSALPSGAATSALQTTVNNTLTAIQANQTNGTQTTQVSNFPVTQPVSGTVTVVQPTGTNLHTVVDSSVLPTGAATSALQTSGNSSLTTIATNTTGLALASQLPATLGSKLTANSISVNIASDQVVPVNGTITVTGGATSANQTNGTQKTQVVDGAGVVQGPALTIAGTNYMPVTLAASATPGSAIVTRSVQISGSDGTNARTLSTDASGNLNVNAISSTLPTGAATSALQTTGNTSLASIDSKTPALGQALAAASVPVVLTAAQLTALTPPTIVTVQPQADVTPATQNITTQDLVSVTTSVANGQGFITGIPTAGSVASFAPSSLETVQFLVTGTWTGTLQVEVSMDGGTTWVVRSIRQTGTAYVSPSFTANFEGGMNLSAMTNVRVRSIAAFTGTATVKAIASLNANAVTVTNPLTLRDSVVQSIANTIKAASTAPLATDTALVVAISPNSIVTSSIKGSAIANAPVQNLYAGTSITTAAYVQLIASTTAVTNSVHIFDSSGQSMILAVGALGSEVNQYYVQPGGETFNLVIPAGSRVSYKALSANATSGYLLVNLLS